MKHNVIEVSGFDYPDGEDRYECVYCKELFPTSKYTKKQVEDMVCEDKSETSAFIDNALSAANFAYINIYKHFKRYVEDRIAIAEEYTKSTCPPLYLYKNKVEGDIEELKRCIKFIKDDVLKLIEKLEKDLKDDETVEENNE